MSKPLQPCLVNPIPTSSSQIVIIYKHTYFDENASDLKDYPYFASRSNRGQGKTCTIHYVEFRCVSTPPSDIGHPGDIWIDLTPDNCGLYAKVGADWKKWPGLLAHDDSLIVHPHVSTRVLWCTKRCVTWLNRKYILPDWAAHRAEFSNDETAHDALSAENIIGRMLTHEAQSPLRMPDGLCSPAAVGPNADVLPNTSESNSFSPFVSASTTSISHTKSRPPLPNLPNPRSSYRQSSPNSLNNKCFVPDIRSEQHLLDKISDLGGENRRLSEEVVRLREGTAHRRSTGPFREVVLTAVGEAAFSEELLDLAKDAAISQLMKTVTQLSGELHAARTSYLDEMTGLSKKLDAAEVSRLELIRCLTEFHQIFKNETSRILTLEDDLLAKNIQSINEPTTTSNTFDQNTDSDNNASSRTPSERTQQSSPDIDSQSFPSKSETVSPGITEPEQFIPPKPHPVSFSTVTDASAIDLPKDHSHPLSLLHPQSIDIKHHVDFPGDESSFRNGGNFVTHLASPTTHVPSSTLTNHSETQISRKRRLSEVVGAETTHRSVVRRAENDRFRKESLESTPSPAAIEIADFAEPSTSAGDDLGISNSVKEELAQLCLLGRTQSSECPSRNEKDERRLKQDHLDKLYTLDADRYFCHACFIRSEKVPDHSHKPPSASFPKNVSSHVLIGHYERRHPETCKKFIDLWSRVEA